MWRLAQTALSTNFVGEVKDYKELIQHLNDQKTQKDISEFCTFNNIAVLFSLRKNVPIIINIFLCC